MTGIYQIRNTKNGKVYIGSAKNMRVRWGRHTSALNLGKHHSRHLQSAWEKHGAAAFTFEPLIECAPSMLLHYEQQFLNQWTPQYNVCPTAGNSLGVVCSPERRAKIAVKARGRKLSPAHKDAIGAAGVGRGASAAAKANMTAAQQTMVRSADALDAAAKRMVAMNTDPTIKAKMLAARKLAKPAVSDEERSNRSKRMREFNLRRAGKL